VDIKLYSSKRSCGSAKRLAQGRSGRKPNIQQGYQMEQNLLLLLLEALQLQRSFGLLHLCYVTLYIVFPSIFWSS